MQPCNNNRSFALFIGELRTLNTSSREKKKTGLFQTSPSSSKKLILARFKRSCNCKSLWLALSCCCKSTLDKKRLLPDIAMTQVMPWLTNLCTQCRRCCDLVTVRIIDDEADGLIAHRVQQRLDDHRKYVDDWAGYSATCVFAGAAVV